MPYHCDRQPSLWKGAVAGLTGGLVGAWTMNQFQAGLSKLNRHNADDSQQSEGSEDATQKAASALVEPVLDRSLSKEEKQTAGPIVHYAFGAAVGAAYGAIAERTPGVSRVWGTPFATALWLGADEIGVPLAGLSKASTEYPASSHASALVAHLVYGVTTDVVRRIVRAAV